MAVPHLAGAVALLWPASSALMGDINATRALLDQSAVDTNDTSCGGTAAKNNVWGEGNLDVYTAVTRATRDTKSTLSGAITDAATGPLPQNDNRTTTAVAIGAYSLQLPTGTYNITVRGFGYSAQTITGLSVAAGTTTRNVQLTSLPRYSISGTARDVLGNTLGAVAVGWRAHLSQVQRRMRMATTRLPASHRAHTCSASSRGTAMSLLGKP